MSQNSAIVLGLILMIWVFFLLKSRRSMQIINRYEVMILMPLAMTCNVLAVAYFLQFAWLMGIFQLLVGLVVGGIGALLHPDKTAAQLARGTIPQDSPEARLQITRGDSAKMLIISVLVGLLTSISLAALCMHYDIRVFITIPLAFVTWPIFVFLSTSLVTITHGLSIGWHSADRENNQQAIPTDEVCENCGAPMVIKFGRFGQFLSCSNYPECHTTRV